MGYVNDNINQLEKSPLANAPYADCLVHTKRLYPDFYYQGYLWKTNISENNRREAIAGFEIQGYEVSENDIAYDVYGKRLIQETWAIFIREKDGSKVDPEMVKPPLEVYEAYMEFINRK